MKTRFHRQHSRILINSIVSVSVLISFSISITTSLALRESGLGDLELYKITWKGPLNSDEIFNEDSVVDIATNSNQRYKCIVPDQVDKLSNFDYSARNSSSDSEQDDQDKTQEKNPYKLLEPLSKKNTCSVKYEAYWIYELCHGKFLRQYHEEGARFQSKISQEYYLGRMEPEQIALQEEEYMREFTEAEKAGLSSRPTILINGHHKPYITFNMTGGTACDLTKRSRAARILYVCNEEPKLELYSIKEVSTCEYEAIVLSPLLCQHKDFKVDTTTQHEIRCYSVDGSPTKPEKTLEPEEDDESRDSFDRRRVIHMDHELFYLVNLIQT